MNKKLTKYLKIKNEIALKNYLKKQKKTNDRKKNSNRNSASFNIK